MNPLAVYIHWPFCKSKCPYCDFNSHVRENVEQNRWQQALLRELDYMAGHVPGRTVTSIFFGGGTPSLMPPGTAEALIRRVHDIWDVSDDIEITLEANPTSVETATFKDFKAAGVNRVSLGVQSLRDDELRFLGRGHNAKEALKAIELARTTFDRYSFDLIYARPHQTLETWEQELTEGLTHADGHLSLYQLTIEENTAFHHAYANGGFTLPDETASEALYRLTEDIMMARGLKPYEISNYATPGQESRHNLAYWEGIDYIGVGPGAHGRISIPERHATQTLKSPERWLENTERQGHAVEIWQPVERQQEIEERVMMGLRLTDGIDYAAFKKRAGYELKPHLNQHKHDLYVAEGLLENSPARLQATLKGRLVLNKLIEDLLY
jgi:oxygen-independent coproporphyrinogen-3 oxidase